MAAVISKVEQAESRTRDRAPILTLTRVGFAIVTLILVAGWFLPLDRYLSPSRGMGYALGIIGGSLMLLLLVYPLRKRLPLFSFVGSARIWFQIHMALGVLGPLAILYHCLYRLGATNSNVALVCMLVVSGSGVIGRYLYSRIHHGLYGRQATLAEFRAESERLRIETAGIARILPELATRLDKSEQRIAASVPFLPKPLTASLLFRIERARVRHYVRVALHNAAKESPVIANHEHTMATTARRYADERLSAARRVAEFEACAKLFGLWHVLHLPLFFMLLLAGIVHVIAVHVY